MQINLDLNILENFYTRTKLSDHHRTDCQLPIKTVITAFIMPISKRKFRS